MAGSDGSPGRIRFGLANDTTSGLLPFRQVRPLCASCAASAAWHEAASVRAGYQPLCPSLSAGTDARNMRQFHCPERYDEGPSSLQTHD